MSGGPRVEMCLNSGLNTIRLDGTEFITVQHVRSSGLASSPAFLLFCCRCLLPSHAAYRRSFALAQGVYAQVPPTVSLGSSSSSSIGGVSVTVPPQDVAVAGCESGPLVADPGTVVRACPQLQTTFNASQVTPSYCLASF